MLHQDRLDADLTPAGLPGGLGEVLARDEMLGHEIVELCHPPVSTRGAQEPLGLRRHALREDRQLVREHPRSAA
jgi:hypothetical protein